MPALIIGIVLVIIVLIIATDSIRRQRGTVVEERLGRYTDLGSFVTVAEDDKKEKEKKPSVIAERMEGLLSRGSFGTKWRGALARADLKLTVTEFLALHVISMFALAVEPFLSCLLAI